MPCARTTADTGVWCGEKKIASIGITVRRRITVHGLAINCNNDLGWFNHINACGLNKPSTSLLEELKCVANGNSPNISNTVAVAGKFLESWKKVFEMETLPIERLNPDADREIESILSRA